MNICKQLHPKRKKKKKKKENAEANDIAVSVMIKFCSFAGKCVLTGHLCNTIMKFKG